MDDILKKHMHEQAKASLCLYGAYVLYELAKDKPRSNIKKWLEDKAGEFMKDHFMVDEDV